MGLVCVSSSSQKLERKSFNIRVSYTWKNNINRYPNKLLFFRSSSIRFQWSHYLLESTELDLKLILSDFLCYFLIKSIPYKNRFMIRSAKDNNILDKMIRCRVGGRTGLAGRSRGRMSVRPPALII